MIFSPYFLYAIEVKIDQLNHVSVSMPRYPVAFV